MEIGVAGIVPAVLHTVNAAGVSMGAGAVAQSAAAAAASSAGAAVYAKLDLVGSNDAGSPRESKKTRPTTRERSTLPPGLPKVLGRPVSSEPTPPSTPLEGGQLTPVGVHSFNSSSRDTSSLDIASGDPDNPSIDVRMIVARLQAKPLTGQVVAWAWDRAAELSQTKRAPPVSLLAALWPATESCAGRCTAQDVVEIVDAWLVLLQRWPRHFVLAPDIVRVLSERTIPAAVKRMSDSRLAQLCRACRAIAQHLADPSFSQLNFGVRRKVASARDLVQPIFALIVAETAWRTVDHMRCVSPDLLTLLVGSSTAWRWTIVPNHDSSALVAMKESTRAALGVVKKALENSAAAHDQE